MAILVKKGVDCTINSKITDPLGRYVMLKAEFEDKMYVLVNIYAPNEDKDIVNCLNNVLMTLRINCMKKGVKETSIIPQMQSLIRREVT